MYASGGLNRPLVWDKPKILEWGSEFPTFMDGAIDWTTVKLKNNLKKLRKNTAIICKKLI